jgi:hypothetical protein
MQSVKEFVLNRFPHFRTSATGTFTAEHFESAITSALQEREEQIDVLLKRLIWVMEKSQKIAACEVCAEIETEARKVRAALSSPEPSPAAAPQKQEDK